MSQCVSPALQGLFRDLMTGRSIHGEEPSRGHVVTGRRIGSTWSIARVGEYRNRRPG